MAAGVRQKVILACTECKQRNYNTMKNKRNNPDRIELMKYCKRHSTRRLNNLYTDIDGDVRMANNNSNGSKQDSKEELAKAAQASAKKSQNSKKEGKKGGLIAYLKGVRQEFKKVVWPTREELVTDTVVVFACVIFFAVTFWLIDTGFLAALKGILGITLS